MILVAEIFSTQPTRPKDILPGLQRKAQLYIIKYSKVSEMFQEQSQRVLCCMPLDIIIQLLGGTGMPQAPNSSTKSFLFVPYK